MQCPNCKEELKDGNLYCEKCGYEIQMVPDFEPDVDGSILISLRDIQKNVLEETQDNQSIQKEQIKLSQRMKNYQKEHKMVFYMLTTFCVSFCALFIAGIIFLVSYLSPNVQYKKAIEAYEKKNYSESLEYVEHTVMLKPS